MRTVCLDAALRDRPGVDGFNGLSQRIREAARRVGALPLPITSRHSVLLFELSSWQFALVGLEFQSYLTRGLFSFTLSNIQAQ